ncbi:CaiB/BaiF CoA transferase family protein [Nonomuraea purpurea]|uniref:CaiB/BaiF CoA transferase family protein n=1 Tax=Nonomuraea purpurea TaxID=1849276 RepID=A0ABV8GNA9_9ACTN
MDRESFYARARHDVPGPMDGIKVLDVTKVWAGPMATCTLADLGAEVIRVEMPGNREGLMPPELPGTGLSWMRQTINRNKRSLGLDLRKPGGPETFLRLAATADVIVENYLPGTLERWGVGYEQCRAVKADLVYVSISGFGQYGPDAGRPGYDPAIQAAAGWMAFNGDPGRPPMRAPTFLADDVAALHAVIGTLAALRHRDTTGAGQHVDVSMLDALLATSDGHLTLAAGGAAAPRTGNQVELVVPANCYACADGHVYIAVALDRQWRALAEAIGRPGLARADGFATNAERLSNRDAVNALVADWCARRSAAEVESALTARGLIAQRVRTFAEAAKDPHVHERDMLQETELSNGATAPLTGPAVKFSHTPTRVRTGAPAPGAHTEEILDGLGLDAVARDSLRASGAI